MSPTILFMTGAGTEETFERKKVYYEVVKNLTPEDMRYTYYLD